MRRFLLLCALPLSFFLNATSALAVNSGIDVYADVSGKIPYFSFTQQPNEDWTFSTDGLSGALPDTVLHVQDSTTGAFIAGNDDDGNPANSGLSSTVVVPRTGTTRSMVVVLRAWTTDRYGTCTFTATSSLGAVQTYNGVSFGGTRYDVGSLTAGTVVTTAELASGSSDTVLVVASFAGAHAVGFDDDCGTGFMSRVSLAEDCPTCSIIVGNWSLTGSSTMNLVWDGDVSTTDYDCDGLGMTLESQSLGTVWDNVPRGCGGSSDTRGTDTDQDGLSDGAEVLGAENLGVAIKLPTWGADPRQRDLYVEFDWRKCYSLLTNSCPQGIDSGKMGAGKTDVQFQQLVVDPLKAEFENNIRLHLDVGRVNTDPGIATDWGAWGGAAIVDTSPAPGPGECGDQGNQPERVGFFHHSLSYPPESTSPPGGVVGRSCRVPGPMFTTMVNAVRIISHEMGHNLGLQHGGRPPSASVNYKPNYISIMNYIYQFSMPTPRTFSHGNAMPAAAQSLNPTALNETVGLGSTWSDPNLKTLVLTSLQNNLCPVTAFSNGTCVNLSTGAVDWNRDGVFDTSSVQGRVAELNQTGYRESKWANQQQLKDSGDDMGDYQSRTKSAVHCWPKSIEPVDMG